MTALAANMDREAAALTRTQDAITALITKLDEAIGAEREARILQNYAEREARQLVATDLKVFSTKIFVGLGLTVFIAQFALTLVGPAIRAGLRLP